MRRVTRRATRVKLVRRPGRRRGVKAWSPADVAALKRGYKVHSASSVAKSLKRSISSVKAKIRVLGLLKGRRRKAAGKKGPARKGMRAGRRRSKR
ncbi:MAG TPA: hypothetical protein VN285_00775 [Candidatus Deferrimicrobium sp.]|nr:hypothetical protein [Candidatus Deferrimicrobium sp.]